MEETLTLPPLRDDLRLLSGPPLKDGTTTWTLQDAIRNRFFRVGWPEFEILSRWSLGTTDSVVAGVNRETTLHISETDVQTLERFLIMNSLLAPEGPAVLGPLKAKVMKRGPGPFSWLLRHYLFIRIPLVHPDKFLDRTLPAARLLLSRPFQWMLGVMGVMGFYLVLRQWDAFAGTFLYFFSLRGLALYAVAIFVAKVIHDLGHAYTAKHYGLKVPTMGVAFLVLFPMLYSDTSESWKVKSRASRLKIVSAGVLSEVGLAVLATLLWSFLPDGPIRSACFILATVTWVGSILLNLSPFLRFDGYYLLSDLVDVPNLHARAGALGKWYLRKRVLGWDAPCPEKFPPRKTGFLILFAYATWIYRLILFTAIALLVYYLFFKAMGIFLFSVEIAWFIALPICRELAEWWRNRSRFGMNSRLLFSVSILLVVILLLTLPWRAPVEVPAVLKPKAIVAIYPPFSARISEVLVRDAQIVQGGDLLFILDSPEITYKEAAAHNDVILLRNQLNRQMTKEDFLERSLVIQKQLAGALTQRQGYRARKKQLKVKAPRRGMITDLMDALRPGLWINERQRLASLIDKSGAIVEGYVVEDLLESVRAGDQGRFYAESVEMPPVNCTVIEIDPTSTRRLEEPYLASLFGGDIPVTAEGEREWTPHKTIYRVILSPHHQARPPDQVIRGTVRIKGKPQSLLSRAWRRIHAVLIRESGF